MYQCTADLSLSWGSFQKILQLSLKLNNTATIQNIKIETKWHPLEAPGPSEERFWEEQNVKKACFTNMSQLHKNVSFKRARTMFYSLHYAHYATIPTVTMLGMCWMNEGMNEYFLIREVYLYLHPSVVPVSRHGLWSSGTFSGSVSAKRSTQVIWYINYYILFWSPNAFGI